MVFLTAWLGKHTNTHCVCLQIPVTCCRSPWSCWTPVYTTPTWRTNPLFRNSQQWTEESMMEETYRRTCSGWVKFRKSTAPCVIYSPCVQALWIQTEQHIWWSMCVEIWMPCGVSGEHLNNLESTGCPMTVAVIVMIIIVTHDMIIGTCSCCLWPCGFASQASYWSYIPDQCNISTLRSTTNGAKSLSRNHKRRMS